MRINPLSLNNNQMGFGTKTKIEGTFFENLPVKSQRQVNNWISKLSNDKHPTREFWITGNLDKNPRVCAVVRQDLGYGIEETKDTAEFLRKPLTTIQKLYKKAAKEAVRDNKDINRIEEITLKKFNE